MKRILQATAAIFLVLAMVGCGTKSVANGKRNGKLICDASFYPMYDFAKKIGGDKVELTNMVPAGTEPHDWDPSANDIIALNRADVFIYSGAGMEPWVSDVLSSLDNKSLISVEASKGITLLEEGQGTNDPHVWLNPQNAKKEMENIKDAFCKADSKNKGYYQQNYEKYASEFDKLDQEYRDVLSKLPHKDIIVAHQAFGYLCKAYGLKQTAIEGLSADSEPNSKQMAQIIQYAKDKQVSTIFFEELVSPKVAQTIAKATGANAKALNPVEGLSAKELAAGDDYFSVMRQNLKILKEALQ